VRFHNYHVEFKGNFYSVPFQFVKDEVLIRATSGTIEILKDNKRIASHPRIKPDKKYGYNTLPEHMPEKHRFQAEWTPERLIKWAEKIGPDTMTYVNKVMQNRQHPEQGFRASLGILKLSNTYGQAALEKSCAQALEYGKYSYKALKIIIDNLPNIPLDTDQPIPEHSNVRGREYFRQVVNGGEG
jgi:transposase